MVPVLKLDRVSKIYKNKKVVDNVTFNIVKGEIFGFVGPNGAGKSTTLKMICGLASPTTGKILINGKTLNNNFEKNIADIGAFIEIPDMYTYLSGMDNLKIFASLYGKTAIARIPSIVRMVGLENRIKDKVGTYSLGMKQRLGLAQALLNKPKLLILDEPTNGLDPNGIIEVRQLIHDLAKNHNMAILISSHNLSELQQMCDTIAIINRGKIIDYKTMDEIKSEVAFAQQMSLKVDYPHYAGRLLEDALKQDVQIIGNKVILTLPETRIAEILAFLVKNRLTIFGLEKINKSLEELFLEIIKRDSDSTSIF